METWQWLITSVLGLSFLGDIVLRSRRRKNNAEADHAQHDADKAEVERLHLMIDKQQESLNKYLDIETRNAERISQLNQALNDKTDQIRKLTEQVIASEHGRNADKDEITRLTGECGRLRMLVEHYKRWHCQFADCINRIPPNAELKGQPYTPPDIELVNPTEQISVVVNNNQ